jgi:hypothetical protein
MSELSKNPSFKATIITVITTTKEGEPLMKTRANGSKSPYALCSAKITEGPLNGKSVWAQRTLENADGVAKDPVAKGDDVSVIVSTVTGPDGKLKPFFEVATSISATDEEILLALGLSVEPAQPVLATDDVEDTGAPAVATKPRQ